MFRNILLLLKIMMLDLFGINRAFHAKDKKEKRKLLSFAVIFIFSITAITGASFVYSYALAVSFEMFGILELLLFVMMVASCITAIFTTIYKGSGILFEFKDYDALMSMPVKTSEIVCSRIIMLNIENIIFVLIIMIPTGIIYSLKSSPEFIFYIIFVATLFFIPLVPIIIASIISYFISYVSSKFKHKNFTNILFSFILFFGIMGTSYFTNSSSFDMTNIKEALMNILNKYYPLASLYGEAVINYNLSSMFIFMFISLFLFVIFILIMSYKFKFINSTLAAKNASSNYKIGKLKESSQFFALYKKEMKRYFSSALYVSNTAFGIVFLTIISIGILLFGTDKIGAILEIPGFSDIINFFAPIGISVFIALSCTTACSISMEGINLWILKNLPVNTKLIFKSKLAVNLTIILPAVLVDSIILSIALQTNAVQTLLMFVTPINYAIFISLAGLTINLIFPKLDWITEVSVIKQSSATFVSMIVGIISVFIPIMIIFNIHVIEPLYVVIMPTIIILAINLLLYRFLCTRGVEMFNHIETK